MFTVQMGKIQYSLTSQMLANRDLKCSILCEGVVPYGVILALDHHRNKRQRSSVQNILADNVCLIDHLRPAGENKSTPS